MSDILSVIGARPQFVKAAAVSRALMRAGLKEDILHTGQHYDDAMSGAFLRDLGIDGIVKNLDAGSGNHAEQTSRMMVGIAQHIEAMPVPPKVLLLFGDTNSTIAGAIVASKIGLPIAHVEAGLRSYNRAMPEELNRIVTDHLSDVLLVTEPSGLVNLEREGIADDKVFHVGNCMVDSLVTHREAAIAKAPWADLDLTPGSYALATLHRPSNVDDEAVLGPMLEALSELSGSLPVVFPVHPRTRAKIEGMQLSLADSFRLIEPAPYLTFLGLMAKAKLLITDSGGIQEETTALGVPCITLRPNTERPVTIDEGTNELVAPEPGPMKEAFGRAARGEWKTGTVPQFWDGKAAERTAEVLERWHASRAG